MINRQSFLWSIKPIYIIYQVCKYLLFPLRIAIATFHDWRSFQSPTPLPVPPPRLRHRVHGSLDKDPFLKGGEIAAQNIRDLSSLVNYDIYSFEHVLDFGCGSGRVLRNFQDGPASCQFYGTDIDPESINWCKKNLTNIKWNINGYHPPLPYPDNTFDLIYAISVFTHLNEEFQHLWLDELQRIAKQGAIIILTTHGEHCINKLPAEHQTRINSEGFLYLTGVTGKLRLNKLPDFYQSAYHTKDYIRREWSSYFNIINHVERGINSHQDAVILQKPKSEPNQYFQKRE